MNFIPQLATKFLGAYFSQEYDNGNVSGTATIDWNKGNVQYVTMTGDTTFTFINPQAGMTCALHIAGGYTPTLPSTVRYPADTIPPWTATAGRKDIVSIIYCGIVSLYYAVPTLNVATT